MSECMIVLGLLVFASAWFALGWVAHEWFSERGGGDE